MPDRLRALSASGNFYRKRVDIWPVYRNAQAVILAEKLQAEGEPVGFLDPSRFGVKFVANSVVTSRRMVESNPEMVRRFLTALLQGWRQALAPENQGTAIATLQSYDKDSSLEILTQQLAATLQIVAPEPDFPIGTIDKNAWCQTERIMHAQGLIKEAVDIENALISGFLPGTSDADGIK